MDTRKNTLTIKDRITARLVLRALNRLSDLLSRNFDQYPYKYDHLAHHIADGLSVSELNVHAMLVSRLLSSLYKDKSDSQRNDFDKRNFAELSDAFNDIDAWLE